jgi:glucosamine--fructose-6-phosphate aminotransferase (isomerizing)
MLEEIYAQPEAVRATAEDPDLAETLVLLEPPLSRVRRILVAATGSSRHAGIAAKFMIESLAGIPVTVEYASELQYGSSLPGPDTMVIVVTQSGETADTVAALRTAHDQGASVIAISNVDDATIMREADFRLHTPAGAERAVPSTKTFTAQLATLYLLALAAAASRKRISPAEHSAGVRELLDIPKKIVTTLGLDGACERMASSLTDCQKFVFAGRGIHRCVALDGALKLKETTYRGAQAYAGGELWHGPLATVDHETAIFFALSRDRRDKKSVARYQQTLSNARSLKGRARMVIALCIDDDDAALSAGDTAFPIPCAPELLLPILEIVPLQLFAYHLAVGLGHDVDHPRNLTKFVLQERL